MNYWDQSLTDCLSHQRHIALFCPPTACLVCPPKVTVRQPYLLSLQSAYLECEAHSTILPSCCLHSLHTLSVRHTALFVLPVQSAHLECEAHITSRPSCSVCTPWVWGTQHYFSFLFSLHTLNVRHTARVFLSVTCFLFSLHTFSVRHTTLFFLPVQSVHLECEAHSTIFPSCSVLTPWVWGTQHYSSFMFSLHTLSVRHTARVFLPVPFFLFSLQNVIFTS